MQGETIAGKAEAVAPDIVPKTVWSHAAAEFTGVLSALAQLSFPGVVVKVIPFDQKLVLVGEHFDLTYIV